MGRGRRGGQRRDGAGPTPPDASTRSLPRWLPPAIYALVTLVLFREFIVSDGMLFGVDTLSLGYVAREFYARAVRELATFPLWNPFILGGTPFVESTIGGDTFYPTTVLAFVLELHRALGWKLVLHVFVAGLVAYGWIRSLGFSPATAFVCGLTYLLAPYLVTLIYPGHDGKLFVTALSPLLFWMAEWSLRGRGWLPFAALGLTVALVLYTPHYQAAYFLFGAVGAYYVFRALEIWRAERAGRRAAAKFGAFLLAAVLGAVAASIQVVPPLWYVGHYSRRTATTTAAEAARNIEYASSWSLHPEEIGGLVVPEFVGSSVETTGWTSSTYWGRNAFKLNHEYAGLLVLLLAGLGFVGRRRRGLQWFFLGLGAAALLYALGRHTPVWRIFYEVLPGIRLFRAPSMTAFVFGLSALTLAAFGIERLLDGAGAVAEEALVRRTARYLWGTTALAAALTVLAGTGPLTAMWTAVLYHDMGPEQSAALERARPFIVRGFWIATAFVAATAGVCEALRRGWLGRRGALAGLAALVGLDLFRVDAAFVQVVDPRSYFAPDDALRYLMERRQGTEPFRVLSLAQGAQDVLPALYGLDLAAGHHPNDLARYRELIGMVGSGLPENLLRSQRILATTNVRYLLVPPSLASQIGLQEVARGRRYVAYEFPGSLPRARLVTQAVVLPDSQAVAFMMSDAFEPARQVVLAEPPPLSLDGGSAHGSVRWRERGPNRLALEVQADRPALLVLAENWFPSWHSRVDGRSAPLLRANHAFRAIPVPAGNHLVELTYDSQLLRWSLLATLGGLLALLASGGVSWYRGRRGDGRGRAHA